MKTRNLFLCAAAVLSLVACNGKQEPVGPTPVPFTPKASISGAELKNNAIEVNSDAKTIALSVVANVSWTLESNADWAVVSPSSKVIEDEKEATTSVSLAIAENAGDERTATLTFKAKDINDVVITVKQAKHAFNPSAEISGEAVQSDKIAAGCEGGEFTLKVVANVSWTLESNQDWAKFDPASATITDEQSKETAVTLTIDPNAGDARNARIVLKAEGVADKTITIEQSKNDAYLDVLDENTTPIRTFEAIGAGESVAILVEASSKPEITPDVDWLTVSSVTEFNPEDYWNLKLVIAPNASSDAREGHVTFSVNGADDVVLTVTQGSVGILEISVEYITYKSAYITVTPSDETLTYYSVLMTRELYDDLLGQGATDDLLPAFFARKNAEGYEMTVQEYLGYVLKSGEDYYDYTDLDPETELVFLTQYMDGDGNPLSSAFKAVFTTTEKPEVDPDYTAFIGTWKFNHDKYEYNKVTKGFDKVGTGTWTAVIEENLVNEEYYISFPDKADAVSPISSQGYYDRFPMWFQKQEDTPLLVLPFFYYGDLGFFWGFQGVEGYCAMAIVGFYQNSDEDLDGVIFYGDDNTTLVPVYPEEPFVMTTGVFSESKYLGYYGGYVCPTSLEKVSSNTTSARKSSTKAADNRLDIKPAGHLKKADKVNKVNMVKGLSYKKASSCTNYVELNPRRF